MTAPDDAPEPAVVPADILDGLEAIRRTGLTNMFAGRAVAEIAREMGRPDVADWIAEHPDLFIRGVFYGFRAERRGPGE